MGSSPAGEEEQPLTLVSTLPSGHSPQGPSSLTAQEWAAGSRTGGSWGGQRSCLNYKHNEEHPTLRGTRAEVELGALG